MPSVSAVKWVVRGIRDGISGVSSGGLRKLLEMEGFVGGTRAASPALGLPGMGIRVFSGLGSTVGRRRHAPDQGGWNGAVENRAEFAYSCSYCGIYDGLRASEPPPLICLHRKCLLTI